MVYRPDLFKAYKKDEGNIKNPVLVVLSTGFF